MFYSVILFYIQSISVYVQTIRLCEIFAKLTFRYMIRCVAGALSPLGDKGRGGLTQQAQAGGDCTGNGECFTGITDGWAGKWFITYFSLYV